jgi:hypothetical protein
MYNYESQKHWIFTDDGQKAFIKARDNALALLSKAGAFMTFSPLKNVPYGDTWQGMALIDRMVELGDIREVTGPSVAGQHRVFVDARNG